MKSKFISVAILASAGCLAMMPQQIRAQTTFPCSGGPNEQQVGTTMQGSVTVPLCVARQVGNAPAAPSAPLVDYANIAWHPDYDDVWFGGGWTQKGRADPEVLALCNRETGGGCVSIGEYSNSSLAIVKSASGDLVLW
ncbi:MAG: hypothetical protein HC788_03545, partial [Sphingopyxis sp.]|nr:hypothetical protein [Sphingopyxis sp.]